jgi:hypothetical protein
MVEQRTKLILDIRRKDHPPITLDVNETVHLGSDPRNDVIVSAKKNQPKHLQINKINGELALKNLAKNNQTFLNSVALEENKTYLLDENDHILIADTEIIVKKVNALFTPSVSEEVPSSQKQVPPVDKNLNHLFQQESALTPENEKEKIKFHDNPTGSMKLEKKLFPSFFEMMNRPSPLSLTVVKLYSLLLDLFITYFVLGVVIPFYGFEKEVNHFLSSLSAALVLALSDYFPIQLNFLFSLSSFSFIVAFYLVSILQVLLFGSTLSQFLLGLNRKTTNNWSSLFLSRLKTFFYALFLIPGQNYISSHPIFSAFRKVGAFFLILFILISPLIVQNDLKPIITIVPNNNLAIKKELKTQSLDFESRRMQIALQTELPYRFLFIPYPELNKDKSFSIGFEFHDLINEKKLNLKAVEVITFEDLESLTSYSNPLQKIHFRSNLSEWTLKQKKNFIFESLKVSPLNIIAITKLYGPFFSSAISVRNKLLSPFNKNQPEFTIETFSEDSPVFIISNKNKIVLYLVTAEVIHMFDINRQEKDFETLTYFNDYMTKHFTLIDQSESRYKKTQLDLFYALDRLMENDEKSFLTYYVSLVNNDQTRLVSFNEKDLTFQVFKVLRENLRDLSSKLKSEDSQKTINQLIKQLTPMEIPGVRK